uniref:SH3 domain-binding protein 2-like n=2 Tax=Petromyzon marinus TaxID=7757 RepID=A0AAJ7WS08_PETMA|nr:SH3 domain-binding protein 2-like [Petromyzon marinus]
MTFVKAQSSMASNRAEWPIPLRHISAQHLLTMPGDATTFGYLHKKAESSLTLNRWQLRFTVLYRGCIYYYKSCSSVYPQGAFSLRGYNRVLRAPEEFGSHAIYPFKLMHMCKNRRKWYFSAANEEERKKWMGAIRNEIKEQCIITEFYKSSSSRPDSPSEVDSFYGSVERPVAISLSRDGGLQLLGTNNGDFEEPDDDSEDVAHDASHASNGTCWCCCCSAQAALPESEYPTPPRRYESLKNSLSPGYPFEVCGQVREELPTSSSKQRTSIQQQHSPRPVRSVATTSKWAMEMRDIMPEDMFFLTCDGAMVESKIKFSSPRDGLYCVRESSHAGQVLMVWDENSQKIRNFKIYQEGPKIWLDNKLRLHFKTLQELIFYYMEHVLPNQPELRLQYPYQAHGGNALGQLACYCAECTDGNSL